MAKVHFLGIAGSGASAAAAIAQSQGYEVTGCDLNPHNEFTTSFKEAQLFTGHSPGHLKSIDILAATPAIYSLDPKNPELLEAKKLGIEVLTWQDFLGKYLTKDKFVIAVSGTHGKTTTTAMIAKILEDAGRDPTVELGAIIPWWGKNYRIGKGRYFVVEADEFNDNFLNVNPDISVVTNIEMDHPEYFKDFEAVKESFKKFLLQTKETAVVNLSDPALAEIVKKTMKMPHPNVQISSGRGTFVQYINYHNSDLNFSLKIPGKFNLENAKAAMQVALLLGIDPDTIKKSLQNFSGAGRRFEYIGEYNGSRVYSDFGHHPTEIEKTMEAAREKFPKERILLIYQPHMFSRTKALFDDFVRVFRNVPADKTFILDIYPSREVDTGLTSSKELVDAVSKPSISHLGGSALSADGSLNDSQVTKALEKLKPEIKNGDVVFFMSAGDTDKLAKDLVALPAGRPACRTGRQVS